MNYMKQIAEMLGVEIGERFKIKELDFVSYIGTDGFFTELDDDTVSQDDARLVKLITGEWKMEKLPWKPKNGDHYWYHEYDMGCALCRITWSDSSYDLALYKLGKLYRTKAEAKARAEEDAAYWESIREELDEG